MTLPTGNLARRTVDVAGAEIEIRSLSRAEALQLNGYRGREDEAEVFILMAGTGCTEPEAKAFRESNDTDTAGVLIDAILVLSGLAKGDGADPQ